MASIPASSIPAYVSKNLINPPNSCTCGWYVFYALGCGHVYTEYKAVCGATSSSSGDEEFCSSPVPKHYMAVRISERCAQYMENGHVVASPLIY